jgi:pyridoxal phosphate enzyme (YggS family)
MSTGNAVAEQIQSNWQRMVGRVKQAAEGCGRRPEEIRVVGVSKYVDAATTRLLCRAGCHDLAESRPQLLWKKAEQFAETEQPRWHLIGHVQTNKLRRLLRHRPMIHSVDSERLLQAIDRESQRQGLVTEVLLEVNISGDESKTGLPPRALAPLLRMPGLEHVQIVGLMAMAGWGTDTDQAGSQFQQVAQLRDELQAATGQELPELSMGMSGDFPEAIAAGATLVRVGSALFEGVPR